MKLARSETVFRALCGAFLLIAIYCLGRYFHYIVNVVAFPYDWGVSDGDHLNFAHRISSGLPIYMSMESGQVLSIYNPLYHLLVALLGGPDAGMTLARSISLLFWMLCPLTVVFVYGKKWGYFYSLLSGIFILLPSEPFMLLDIVNITADSMMAFIFLVTLILAERCAGRLDVSWKGWFYVGFMAALCFLAKQQGIIAIASVICYLLIKKTGFKKIGVVLLGFVSLLAIFCVWLESVNSGNYLQSTIFTLRRIMSYNPDLAISRLYEFINNNFAFTIAVLASFAFVAFRITKLSVWQVSFVLHLVFLLKILGNGGGGPNYFLTMWITMVMVSVGFISSLVNDRTQRSSPFVLISMNCQKKIVTVGKIFLIGLFLSITLGTVTIHRQLSSSIYPTLGLENLMREYYAAVGELVLAKPNAKVLTNRNVGALVAHGINVENEGSTMFQYAWAHGEVFQPGVILQAIGEKNSI